MYVAVGGTTPLQKSFWILPFYLFSCLDTIEKYPRLLFKKLSPGAPAKANKSNDCWDC